MSSELTANYKAIGNGFLETAKYQLAIDYFTKAIDIDPADAEAYDLRAIVWFQLLDIEKAMQDLELSLKADPAYHIALGHLGEIAVARKNHEHGEQYYAKALEIEPGNLIYLANLAFCKLQQKKDEECISVCNSILKDYPVDIWALNYRGTAYLNQKNYEAAIQDFTTLSYEDKNNGYVHNNLGYAYSKLGNIDEAKYHLNRCISLLPDFAYGHDNLGYVFYLENNFEKALNLINHSIELDPSNSYAFKTRALVYLKQNKTAEAIADLEHALALNFTYDYGDEVETLLAGLNSQG